MNRFLICLTVASLIYLIEALNLECVYEMHENKNLGHIYTCFPQKFRTTFLERNVTSVNNGNTSEPERAVFGFYAEKESFLYLPLNLGTHFPQLESLIVDDCDVQFLVNGDLHGLHDLIVFEVSRNPIEYLGADFFKENTELQVIAFHDCNLQIIDPGILDGLVYLRFADFEKNACVNLKIEKWSELKGLEEKILESCQTNNEWYDERIFDRNLKLEELITTTEIPPSTEMTQTSEPESPTTPCLFEGVTEKLVSETTNANQILECPQHNFLTSAHFITFWFIMVVTLINLIIFKSIPDKNV
ncbi:CLUMA_CG012185, isoform A [Clunio marinus]|uniref:CLUMA_CG012185, isoform A n=1 Tax=Clunio marinus TaxID=568069 RepID=A0A1J1IEC2_9DIPT|nr:CLUMA_CG012185, isoform A [Clunio marinus]